MRLFKSSALGALLFTCGLLGAASPARAQSWGEVVGRVASTDGEAVAGATVLVERTNYGTAADVDGRFSLRLPTGRYRLRVSAVGYRTTSDSVTVRREAPALLAIRLAPDARELQTVEVEARRPVEAGVFEVKPEDVINLPGPFRSAFQAVRVLPGVAANNEISNQFSVRGGGLSENLIYLNGFEVYLPFRPKQGEQEGLGLLNPDLTESLTLYAGGFPARYGGKLSSALDVRYARPEAGDPWRGSASASLLDAGLAVSGAVGRVGLAAGVRRAQAGRFFATQALKGRYDPAYTDGQLALSISLAPGHEVEAVGLYADHRFTLAPTNRKTFFGLVSVDPANPSDFQSVYTDFEGQEEDGFTTAFGGLRLRTRLTERVRMEHDVALFRTDEFERVSITGTAELAQVDPGSGESVRLGTAGQIDFADNEVSVQTITGQGRYHAALGLHALEAGWSARLLDFDDAIDEKSIRLDPEAENPARRRLVLDSLRSTGALSANQFAFYGQDAFDLVPSDPGRFTTTLGLRADHYTFTGEWTISPRLLARYRASPITTLTGSAGVYYQAPTYQELRGKPGPGESVLSALNSGLKSQRSIQVVAGGEHFLTEKRLWVRAEGYYKALSNLVSYTVENVRVGYSGENDAEGYVYGADVQVRGEFVPGLESWVNYGFLMAKEEFVEGFQNRYNAGSVSRPTDQRHTFSMFVQDYVPNNPTWRLHLRGLYGSGYPYTPLNPTESVENVTYLTPGLRNARRYDSYKRVDMGATKEITFTRDGQDRATLALTAELLNVFDMENEAAFTWQSINNQWVREPTRLTPRTVNVRLRVAW